MLELTSPKKHKINLADYNSRQDIALRTFLADFTPFDVDVLEEILFSPLRIIPKKLARSLDVSEQAIRPVLQKLVKVGLLSQDAEAFLADKELRKYFEFELQRFSAEFKPDMEFLQGLLHKVPIHVLPLWYSIPRSSSNIFESIVEKHLLSPQIFQRYLHELHFANPLAHTIMQEVLSAEGSKVSSSDLIAKYNLSRETFEEIMLLLEFSFVCCVRYVREDDHWEEIITPFYEWSQYLEFLKSTDAHTLAQGSIQRKHASDFAFVEELEALLLKPQLKKGNGHLIEKLKLVKLVEEIEGRLSATEAAKEWLDMSLENKALYLYRHPHNQILRTRISSEIATERNIREAEKAIKRVLHRGWILFDEFFRGVLVPLSESSVIVLQRTGKHWKYTTPVYSEEEKVFLHAIAFEWLFECGITAPGVFQGKECFSVTPFGRFLFEE